MINQEFTISLRVRHPLYTDRVIVESLGMTPKIAHALGAQRTTPTGRVLDGSYTETFCVFTLLVRRQGWFEDGVAELLPSLSVHREFLRSIADTGGSSELYVGVFVDSAESVGFTLGIETMTALADLRVRLVGEYYWDSEPVLADVRSDR
jgi:hypothetical protein